MSFRPTWETLRAFGNSKFARVSIFVPLFGYFVLFNEAFDFLIVASMDWVCEAFNGHVCENGDAGHIDNEFMLRRVINIYIALSAISLSTILFQLFCPHEIKKFWHVESYVAENTKIFHHEFNRRIRGPLEAAKPEKVARIEARLQDNKQHDRAKASEMYDRDILSLWFQYQNQRHSIARWACFMLFSVGTILLAYPTVKVFIKVISIIFSS